jgi:hypothetical protein
LLFRTKRASSASMPDTHRLRTPLRALALIILLGVVGYWLAKGAHRGWSQHRVPVPKTDEVTGIAYVEYDERYVPGVEVLAAGTGLAVMIFAATFFLRVSPTRPPPLP